jgi:hypothetical protein
MLRRLLNMMLFGVMVTACAQAAPTPTSSQVQPAPTVSLPTPPTFPTAIPEATASPAPTAPSLFPPVTADEWQKGPVTARVIIIEYGDFQ